MSIESLSHEIPDIPKAGLQGMNGFDPDKRVDVKEANTVEKPTSGFDPDKRVEPDKILEEVKNGERKLETSQEKGNYGEMRTDQDLKEKGYERISLDRVTDLNAPGRQGIDGVYYKEGGEPEYMIVDSKYGSSQLSDTDDGRQMSEKWIDNRLDNAVGKEKADEIRMEKLMNSDNVVSYVARIGEDGNVTYERVDSNGYVMKGMLSDEKSAV